ncbi:MAG: hypothetical protein AB1465_02735 [Patescibacteria group bacterium]
MEEKKVIILPSDFTIDDVAASHCFLEVHKCKLDDVEVRFYTHEMLGQVFGDNVYLIDCGPNDYKERGSGCATGVVCSDFRIADEALDKLIEVLTRNNQTGFLRQRNFALPFAIRSVQRSVQRTEKDPLLILRNALEVIDVYLRLKRTKRFDAGEARAMILESKTLNAVDGEMQAFLAEYRGGKKMEYHVFTLPWYIAARMVLEDKVSDIRDSAKFWFRMFLAIEKARKEAIESLEGRKCFIEIEGSYWFVAETDNPFITEYVFRYCVVAIVRNPVTGNVAIMTARRNRRFDMSQVGRVLNQKEKGIWYYNDRIQAVLNGSARRPQPATKLTIAEIFEIVKENII